MATVAAALKVIILVGWAAASILREFIWRDRLPFVLADETRRLLFDQRGLGPGSDQILFFNCMLVTLTFGQWWAIGWLFARLRSLSTARRRSV
jgi:hypothetical protein